MAKAKPSPPPDLDPVRLAADLDILADPTRIRVVRLLAVAPTHVGGLCESIGISQPAMSHHLSLLRAAHVVDTLRDGKRIVYSLEPAWADSIRARFAALFAA